MIKNGGILTYKENNEPCWIHDFSEAEKMRKEYRYEIKKQVLKERKKMRSWLARKFLGFSWHTVIKGYQYRKKLNKVLKDAGLPPQKKKFN